MKTTTLFVLVAVAAGGFASATPPSWPDEVLELFATLPVQDGGRVKPLDTVARFALLRLNGKRTLTLDTAPGRRTALEWFMDSLFFPEVADGYRCFSVESSEVIVALGLTPRGKKRDRYSYNELRPGIERLMRLAEEASRTPKDQRDFMDGQLVTLANNVLAYEALTHFLNIARAEFTVSDNALLAGAFPGREKIRASEVVSETPKHLVALVASAEGLDDAEREAIARGMHELFEQLDYLASAGRLLALVPPSSPDASEWLSPGAVVEAAFDAEFEGAPPIDIITMLERLVAAPPDEPAFRDALLALHTRIADAARARGEYRRIPLEVTYYRGRFLFLAQWLFVLAFVLIAAGWALPQSARWATALNLSLVPPLMLLALGITLRCIIRGRPPVTTLYETILFTTMVAALLGFAVEFVNRNRIAMSVGAVLGMLGMFFASRYEAREGLDTMPSVIAVLDTNFWLATHVTTIVAGYAAGLFAAALAHIYVFGRLFGFKRETPLFYPDLGRVIYGVTAFCLVFTLIGTVLGGVWAAQSWGRFWGWDPKENGALMIVLWALAVMHAKRGGYLRHDGIAVSAVALGMIIVFAWWGVNALGVGLHSYGFTSGMWQSLTLFWVVEGVVMLIGIAVTAMRPARAG